MSSQQSSNSKQVVSQKQLSGDIWVGQWSGVQHTVIPWSIHEPVCVDYMCAWVKECKFDKQWDHYLKLQCT